MDIGKEDPRSRISLLRENEALQRRLEEVEQTLEAIRSGEVDAIVVGGASGEQVYTLAGAEHAYRTIVETMNEAALTTDLDGTILFCNQRFCDLIRTPANEVLGRKVAAFAAEPQQPTLEKAMADAQVRAIRRHLTLRAVDGTAVPVLLSVSLLQTPDTASLCFVASDLTELEESAHSIRVLREQRQALEESEERYRRFFMDDLTGDFLATPEGTLIECNPAFARIYGFDSPAAAEQYDISQFNPSGWRVLIPRLAEQGKIYNHESWHIRPDGEKIYVVANVVGQFDDAGELTVVKGYLFEDTERKRAEEALERANLRLRDRNEDLVALNEQLLTQREELQRQTLELEEMKDEARETAVEMERLARISMESPDPIFRVAPEGTILYRNPAAEALCRQWNTDFGKTVPASVREIVSAARTAEDVVRCERAFGGRIYALTASAAPGGDYVNLFAHDISVRVQAEQHLFQSQQRLKLAQQAARIGVFEWNLVNDTSVWTEEFCTIFGLKPQDATHASEAWQRIVPPEDRARVEQAFYAATAERRPEFATEYRILRPDGAIGWVINMTAITYDDAGQPVRMTGAAVDITERKQAELALQEAERKYRELVQYAPAGIYEIDFRRRRFTSVNDAMVHMVGYSRDELLAMDPSALLDEEGRACFQTRIAMWLSGAEPDRNAEYRIKTREGRTLYVTLDATFTTDEKGEPLGATVVAHDITERKQAEEALRASEERFRALVTASSEVLYRMSPDWSEMRQLHGGGFLANTDRPDRAWLEQYIHPDDQPHVTVAIQEAIRTKSIFELEHRVRRADGSLGWTFSRAVPLMDKNGEIVEWFGAASDVTERKRAEEALRELTKTLESKVVQRTAELEHRARQLQKLTLELSQAEDRERKRLADILHDDLQQQLAAVKFHLNIMAGRAREHVAVQKAVGQLDGMLGEAIETSRSLSHELSPAVLYHGDLGETFEWLAGQIRTKHGLDVRVHCDGEIDAQSEGLKAFLFRTAQEQLFNVVKHARAKEAVVRVRRRGPYICLAVSDRGRGFNPHDLRAVKGFGLFSIRERTQLLGGRMRIHSARGRGSRLFIAVPDEPVAAGPRARPTPDIHSTGGMRPTPGTHGGVPLLRVLVADDHEVVRQGLMAVLGEEPDIEIVGEAANGREAVDLANRLKPDVVIMDVAMPLMSGDEAARQIKKHLPGTRIVALSMCEEPGAVQRMQEAGAEAYLLKTAPAEEMLAMIRKTE